ncbi:MAG: hypothetical protein ACRD6X_11170 [Pyrinomonadaceae bacterium]
MSDRNGQTTEKRERKRPSFWQFYNANVLSLGKERLVKRELPGVCCWGETEIINDLFGWKLKLKRDEYECGSELEARYLEIFLHLGWSEVYVPKETKDLASFMPELEALKAKADEILDRRLRQVFAKPLLKFRVRSGMYQDISEIPNDAKVFNESVVGNYDFEEADEIELEEAYV